jgi:hypothetical protein
LSYEMEISVLDRRGGRTVIALLALVVMLAVYYGIHEPLDPALSLPLAGAALDALVAGLLVSAGGGVGRWLLRRIIVNIGVGARHALSLPDEGISLAEQVSLEGLLGLGVLAWVALALGLFLLLVLNRRAMVGWARDLITALRSAAQTDSGWARWLMRFTAFMLGLALLNAFAPPHTTSMHGHLSEPTHYLAAGRITAAQENLRISFPQSVELLYGLAMGLSGRDTAAAPVHFAFGLLALLAVGGLAKRRAGEDAAGLAAALLLSAYSLWLLFGRPDVDLAVMAFGAAGLVTITEWRERKPVFQLSISLRGSDEVRWLLLAGTFAGLALGVIYTSAGLSLALAFYVAVSARRAALRNLLVVGGAAGLAYLPWALAGALLYHHPIYLNASDVTRSGLLGSGLWWQIPLLPVTATVFGFEGGGAYGFSAGPWLLTAPLLLPLGWRLLDVWKKELARDCLLLLAPLLAFWMAAAALSAAREPTRLMMAAMPAAAIAGALGFAGLPRKPFDTMLMVRVLVGMTLVFSAVDAVRDTTRAQVLPYWVGMVSREEFLGVNAERIPLPELPRHHRGVRSAADSVSSARASSMSS